MQNFGEVHETPVRLEMVSAGSGTLVIFHAVPFQVSANANCLPGANISPTATQLFADTHETACGTALTRAGWASLTSFQPAPFQNSANATFLVLWSGRS